MSLHRLVTMCVVVCAVAVMPTVVQAGPLNLDIDHYPIVYSVGTYITYSPTGGSGGMGLLTATAFPNQYDVDGSHGSLINLDTGNYDDWFSLAVVIDPNTGEGISGTLSLTGVELTDPLSTTVMNMFNSSILTGFGYRDSGILEFTFTQEGEGVPPDGSAIGIILTGVSIPSPIDMTKAWENNSNGFSDTFYMPEPTSALLLGLAGIGMLRRRNRA